MELWRPLVTHFSLASELEDFTHRGAEHSCMFLSYVSICMLWFGSVMVLYGAAVFISCICTSFARVVSPVSAQDGQDAFITAGQLD